VDVIQDGLVQLVLDELVRQETTLRDDIRDGPVELLLCLVVIRGFEQFVNDIEDFSFKHLAFEDLAAERRYVSENFDGRRGSHVNVVCDFAYPVHKGFLNYFLVLVAFEILVLFRYISEIFKPDETVRLDVNIWS